MIFREKPPQNNLKTEIIAKATKFAFLGLDGKTHTHQATIWVKWIASPVNWYKVNLDRSSLGNPGLVGGGGLIKNDKGEWIRGYARAIGSTTSATTKLWALRDVIRLCMALNLQAVVFELDAKLVINLLNKEEKSMNGNEIIVGDCKEGLQRIHQVRIQHCYGKVNKRADVLARRGTLLPQDFVIFLEPPSNVSLLLSLDAIGTLYDRSISLAALLF